MLQVSRRQSLERSAYTCFYRLQVLPPQFCDVLEIIDFLFSLLFFLSWYKDGVMISKLFTCNKWDVKYN